VLDQWKANLLNADKSPDYVLNKEICKLIYGNSPYFTETEISDLDKVNKDIAFDFMKKSLNPADYTFVFVGNIDIESFKEYIKTYWASIKPAQSYNITNKEFSRPKPAKKEIHMGNGDKSSVSLGWYVKENYSQSLSAKTCVFEEYMNIILTDHLRMKLGEIYYIAPVCLADMFLGELTMGGNFSCDPKNSKRLINVVISDINNMAHSNIEKNILDKAKKACKTGWEKSIQDNFVIMFCNISTLS
jgi:zinc protease